MTYARARLWLGMTTVGTLVAASSALLYLRIPEALLGGSQASFATSIAALAAFVALYAVAHTFSDAFGAVIIPRAYGRSAGPIHRTVTRLAQGVLAHSVLLWLIAVAMLAAGRAGGLLGVLAAAFGVSTVLLLARPGLARIIGGVTAVAGDAATRASPDPGFTGGIDGVFSPRRITVPSDWQSTLPAGDLDRVLQRRRAAIESGSWRRGRIFAIVFTLVGVAIAGVLAGADTLGTAAGVIRLSLWFTLWSFLGLLTLPTLSRNAVLAADRDAGVDEAAADALATLDRVGDDEPERPRLIETIFHPVPSVRRRRGDAPPRAGCWDVARTALYLSGGGLGLLARSVHCNAGRPALWVYLPSA